MNEQMQINDAPEQPVLAIRTRTPVGALPQQIGKAYAAIAAYLDELGEAPQGAPYTAYFNMDMDDLDVEMGFPVSRALPAKGEIKPGAIPAGKQAAAMHKGPYSAMEPVYKALAEWTARQGFEPAGISYEFYCNSPMEAPEEELLTRVVLLLK